jgi:hypothetical protein
VHRQILFAAIHGAHPLGQLKLFKFIPDEFVRRAVNLSFINSQALLDEAAVLACMAYVDHYLLIERPIRAKIATTPETSDYTSI